MIKCITVLLCLLIVVPLIAQDREDIEYALDQIAKPLGGIVNDAVLQDANTLGGLPHFQITGGINLRSFTFRDPNNPANDEEWTAGAINVEGRVGLFKGKTIAPTVGGFGSVDLLIRFAFYPIGEEDSITFVPLVGLGLKVGLLRESLALPAISATIQYTGSSTFHLADESNEVYADFTVKVLSLRADVSKNFLLLSPYAGLGFNVNSLNSELWWNYGADHGTYDVNPSVFKLYGGIHKQIFLIGLNAEGGLSGETFYWALGISVGM